MKSIICFFILAIAVQLSGQNADSTIWRYADITYPLGGFTSKAKVDVDYGESATGWGIVSEKLEDNAGKPIKFKSPVDALNWMSERGWELVQSYKSEQDIGLGSKLEYQHFIMRRLESRRRP